MLYDFVNNEALPGTDLDPDSFWAGVDKVVTDLTPQNQELLKIRDELQAQIDKWHRHRVIEPWTPRPTGSSSPTSDICCPNPKISPSPPQASTTRSPRRPARNWWCPYSTRALR
ncbi:malate synthase family protein [Mycobacterium kansasii]|uniref:Malate synthase family protein n=1 Tax=Mycobacterium kansasii TaxID=1768 RepID=A0A1V3X4Z2_MYCKA|nr:malate synthase family protein [Mycobacterium kansasii]